MNKNNSVVAYVASGDTSALQTISDSCEASVGNACRRGVSTVRVGVLVKQKRQTFKPAFIKYHLRDDYIFLKATQPLCPPNPNDVENAMLTSAFTATFGV